MRDNEVDSNAAVSGSDEDYESPVVFDLGSVFEVTKGSSRGSADANNQGLD